MLSVSPVVGIGGECAPPPFGPGGRAHSLAAKGVGESQFQRGDIYCGALYIHKYFVLTRTQLINTALTRINKMGKFFI